MATSFAPLRAQISDGELRLRVLDAAGRAVAATVALSSESQQIRRTQSTDSTGGVDVQRLGHGIYQLTVTASGFAPTSMMVEVQSALPVERVVKLQVAAVDTQVQVNSGGTLIDPERPGASVEIGPAQIAERPTPLPGRSLQELVNTQPGWLYEGNAVLHPRGSEYQTQFVVDGIPLTDNRSPGFGPPMNAEDVDSLQIYTAGIPAEFGRKMGGVVEVTAHRETAEGVHGKLSLSGGSYTTADGFGELQWVQGRDLFSASAEGDRTDHYLNPVVPENYTNSGTAGEFTADCERDLTAKDRVSLHVSHSLARYGVPNELLQQQAGQRVDADNFETMGTAAYQHIFDADTLVHFAGMVRDTSSDLKSNPQATPVIAFQQNSFREGYFKATIEKHWGRQDWKAGLESDAVMLHENFNDVITDPTQFDDGTPLAFAFSGSRPDLEQSAFVEDLVHAGAWTVRAGLRWDHYQLVLNQHAFSPRVSLARYLSSMQMVVHGSYDRAFQTPSSENILLASSPLVTSLNPSVLRLPVQPSRGNYYEGGLSKAIAGQFRVDANVYRRDVSNFADDDQLLNTAVSFPIAFRKAVIYGAETKVELPHWQGFSGFVSYSYQVGNASFPVTGGLFLGDDATSATTQLTGHFPDSQDQRHTARTRLQYQVRPRWWVATEAEYNTGLPFDFQGTPQQALTQYGPNVLSRLNFNRGRILPYWLIGASSGVNLYQPKLGEKALRLQIDGENLADRLDVIDFGGLFSGNAIGPGRSVALRLTANF
jgi:hypothetical protein